MRVVKRNRYYCEFCKKSGGSGGHIAKHERSCTLNPGRVCRVCGMLESVQVPMGELKAILPQVTSPPEFEFGKETALEAAVENAMPRLREITKSCPACIMAALRQSGIPVPIAKSFNFTAEMKAIWAEINENQLEATRYGYG